MERRAVQGGTHAHAARAELIETAGNPNWSEGNQFIYVENFTAVGVSVETKLNRHLDVQLRVINGWDQVSDKSQRSR